MKSSVSLLALALSACLAAGCTTAAAESEESAAAQHEAAFVAEHRAALDSVGAAIRAAEAALPTLPPASP
jgi:hypothetical protein